MRLLAPLTLLLLALPAAPARAAASYDNCVGFIDTLPAVIGTQGVWCLRRDLATAISSGRAIEVLANNVTIDCNGFKVGGLAGGPDSAANAIYAQQRNNLTVRNCLIRGFSSGVFLFGSDGALVEDVVTEGNYQSGIWVYGDNGTIRRNRILDTGTDPYLGSATGIVAQQGSFDILDNTVSGVTRQTYVRGISLSYGPGSTVQGNRIRGLDGVSENYGISIYASPGALARDNHVSGPGGVGILCYGSGTAIVMANAVNGFTTGVDADCRSSGNVVQ